jgi:hypothetical protein
MAKPQKFDQQSKVRSLKTSLSEIASKIASARWSGPHFFGFYER